MLPDYMALVMAAYHKRKNEQDLSIYLIDPSPAQVRDACMAQCRKGYARKDEKVLAAFFEEAPDKATYLDNINNCQIEIFKPLINYINRKTALPELKNIELLAWLIDFEPRPFDRDKDYRPLLKEAALPTKTEAVENGYNVEAQQDAEHVQKTGEDIPTAIIENVKEQTLASVLVVAENKGREKVFPINSKAKKYIFIGTLVLLVLSVLAAIWWGKTDGRPNIYTSSGPQSCMYWADDHFERVSCNQKIEGVLVIALDSARLHDFKKITKPDTITEMAIGHVWYCKYNNKIEFFTGDGDHPVHLELRVRPITPYIINKYVRSGGLTE